MLLWRYCHCNQGYYNINKLKRIKLLLIKTDYSQLVACWICISQISKMRKIHSGGLKIKYNSLIRKKREEITANYFPSYFSIWSVTQEKKFFEKLSKPILCTLVLLVFLVHDLWIVYAEISLPNNLIACIVCVGFF